MLADVSATVSVDYGDTVLDGLNVFAIAKCWMLTSPGSMMLGGSPISGISRQMGSATAVSFRWDQRWGAPHAQR